MTMREWLERAQAARRKALADQKLTAEQREILDEIYDDSPGFAKTLAYGEQCADTDGLAKYEADIAAIRADYELAKSCLVAERDALLRQVVRLTRERNDAVAQISARHGTQGEPAAMEALASTKETPRTNPFAGGWATSWRMR